MKIKLVDIVKRNKQSKEPMPKHKCAFETFEKWFCNEFNIKKISTAQMELTMHIQQKIA